jgi:type IV pilus assembly protein PilY1
MQTNNTLSTKANYLIALLLIATGAHAGLTQLSETPLSGASSVEISPNIMFVLDDSGSMSWDYLPDWAGLTTQLSQSKNPSFNGVAYNPAVTYTPPKYFNTDGTPNTTTYLGQNATNSTNWTAVRDDGFGIQATPATKTSNLVGNAFYYTTLAGEYCTNASMKTCVAASAPSAAYPIAAKLRWCKTAAEAVAATPSAGACQATQIDPVPAPPAAATNIPFNFPRMPAPRASTITISGSSSTSVSSITVDSKIILSSSIAATTDPVAMAASIETSINACTFGKTGTCQIEGYSAVASGSTVTISAPGAITSTPAITKSGTMTMSPTAFARPTTNLAPGENLLTVITSTTTTYPKASTRSDCLLAATTCAFAEEMTNYANWWAYYRTRMQTMKTATSLSFETIGTKFRVGYMSINNNTSLDFQNIASFDASQKKAWYDKIFSARPNNNTPLRVALSNAGRLYAGRLNNLTFNGVAVVDPVQHYCQQNVTILSTDGYWNEGAGFMWNGTSAVGDQDGPGLEVRPQLDGGGPQDQKSTSQITKTLTPTTATQAQIKTDQLQSKAALVETRTFTQPQTSTNQLQSKDAQMQSRTSQLQQRTFTQGQTQTLTQLQAQTSSLQSRSGPLQQRTANLQTRTKTQAQSSTSQLQSMTAQLQSKTYLLQERVTQVQQKTSSNGGTTWTAWTNVASCSPVTSGTNRSQCQTLAQGAWTNASSCTTATGGTTVTNPGTDSEVTTYTTARSCQYTSPSWANVASCSAVAKSTGSPYTVGTAVDCQTTWPNPWVNAASCTTSSTVQCQYTAWTGYANVASCTPLARSAASPYTVGVATQCQTNWTAWADTASTCTSSGTVGCQYGSFTGWTAASGGVCAVVPPSASSPYSVTTKKECRVNYGNWGNAASCNVVSTGATQTQCQYTAWSAWGNVASCAAATQSTGPTSFTTATARNCQTVFTGWTNTGAACVPSATVNCQTVWTPWTNVPTCTYVAGSSECQYTAWTGWANAASCTPTPQSTSPNYTVNIATDCQTTWPNPWVNAASCTTSSTRQCQYAGWTGWTDTASCTAQAPSGASPYSVGLAAQCQTNWTNWSTTASCTAAAGVECRTTWPNPWVNAASCTASAINQCQTIPVIGTWTNTGSCTAGTVAGLTTSCQNVIPPPTSQYVASCTPEGAAAGNGFIGTTCSTATTGPTDVASCTPEAATAANSYIETTCNVIAKGQTPDTLADVAEYYWKTDLRDPLLLPDRCTGGPIVTAASTTYNNVCTNDLKYPKQFMTTYTLGLGASGLMQYQSDYLTSVLGDFFSVKSGLTADTSTGVCSWQKNGVCNWPKPESNEQTNIDDLWHAAVNGRGTYFSADNPTSLAAGISGALAAIEIKDGALSAVSVTSPNLVASDNAVFEVSFKAGEWTGDIIKRSIDSTSGALSAGSIWTLDPAPAAPVYASAKEILAKKVNSGTHTARKIFTYNPGGQSAAGAGDDLKFFLWANLSATEKDYFKKPNIAGLSQFCASGTTCLDAATQLLAAEENLVNFLRGEKANEGPLSDLGKYFRQRTGLLGDIVGSEAVYVQKPVWNYADYGYGAFKSTQASRTAMVYVGANDGMLHGFNATTGSEEWAYIPSIVMPKIYKLADKSYSALHTYSVDGTPSYGDICASDCAAPPVGAGAPVWKSILVGGLNNGGRGYYALDITNPAAPKALWEFTHNNLGYSFGNPVITKLKDGTWVVIIASGYNNTSPGDGKGYLFILNANTGTLIRSISTGVGSSTPIAPSGLSRIAAWANFPDNNNTAQRVYGGDLLGNLWRFDVNGDIPVESPVVYHAQRLATLKDASGAAQPITTKPELGKIKNFPVILVGTGQLLGSDDLVTTQTQSLYAIKDRLTGSSDDYGSPRPLTPAQTSPTPGDFVAQTMTSGTCPIGSTFCTAGDTVTTSTATAVDFSTKDGWYTDFPVAGERVNTDIRLQLGTIAFNTNTPKSGACVPVGVSFAYFLDYRTGGAIPGTVGLSGVKLGDYLATAPSVIRMLDGTIKELIRTDAPGTLIKEVPIAANPLGTRRVSWRELLTEQ